MTMMFIFVTTVTQKYCFSRCRHFYCKHLLQSQRTLYVRVNRGQTLCTNYLITFKLKVYLPPTSVVEVIELESSFCVSVCACVCEHSHDQTVLPMTLVFGLGLALVLS